MKASNFSILKFLFTAFAFLSKAMMPSFIISDEQALVGLADDELAGEDILNAIAKKTNIAINPQLKTQLKKALGDKARQGYLTSTLSRGAKFLYSQVKELDQQTQKDIASGAKKLIERDYYFRRIITAGPGAIQQLLLASDVIAVGKQNLDKNTLPGGETMAVSKIRLAFAVYTAATSGYAVKAIDDVIYSNAVDAVAGTTVMPSALLNGEVTITIDGQVRLNMPIKRFFRDGIPSGENVEGLSDAVELKSPILIRDKQIIQINIQLAATGTIPATASSNTNTYYLEARLLGDAIAPRG